MAAVPPYSVSLPCAPNEVCSKNLAHCRRTCPDNLVVSRISMVYLYVSVQAVRDTYTPITYRYVGTVRTVVMLLHCNISRARAPASMNFENAGPVA